MQPRVVLALVTLPLAACIRVSTMRLAPARAAVPVDSVRVFATHAPDEYTEIAILHTIALVASDARSLDALRKRAAQLGANGLLLARNGIHRTGTGVIGGDRRNGHVIIGTFDADDTDFQRAVAIIYKSR
jgi:hypothetical protein